MQETTIALDGLSSVRVKPVVARFDGGMLSSDTGVLVLGEIERRLRISERLASCIEDRRDPTRIIHGLADMIGFRMKMIAAWRIVRHFILAIRIRARFVHIATVNH